MRFSTILASIMFGPVAVIVMGFAASVMVLAVIDAIRRGAVKTKFGMETRRQDEPITFWICITGLAVAALTMLGAFGFVFVGWLRQWDG